MRAPGWNRNAALRRRAGGDVRGRHGADLVLALGRGAGYALSTLLLLGVEFFGSVGMGAQRWLEIGPLRLQPSELAKITTIMALGRLLRLGRYQENLAPGLRAGRGGDRAVAGASGRAPAGPGHRAADRGGRRRGDLCRRGALGLFRRCHRVGAGWSRVFTSRGTGWQILQDYQYRRIDAFLDPTLDPLGAGYHINQAMIALGSGGWSGRGFMEGTQSRLNFPARKTHRFHLHHAGRGIRLRRRRVAAGAVCHDPRAFAC